MGYEWDFAPVVAGFSLLLEGLANSLLLSVLAFLIGLPGGIALAVMRLSRRRGVAWPAGFMVDFIRGTPALVQLFWFFFVLPRLLDTAIEPFTAALVTLSILSAAFVSEVFRAGIASVEFGQWEAARAIGMSSRQALRIVVLPQAVKRMIPVFLERAIELFKTSTIASIISYADLLFRAQDIAQSSFRPLEVFTVTAAMYLIVIAILSEATRLVEHRLARTGEGTLR
jgi:polar amino acid transport system permease protein